MDERTKKILLALIPGELCVILAVFMFFRANQNNDTTSIYVAIGSIVAGSLISGLNVLKIIREK